MRENSCGPVRVTGIARVVAFALAIACGGASERDTDATTSAASSVVAAGTESLVVAGWNIEWFGDPSNGPRNEEAQRRGAAATVREVGADVWALAEIVDVAEWSRLLADVAPQYDGVLASDRQVENGRRWYGAREQKLALLFDRDRVTLRRARVILSEHDTDFAGRPPLEAVLRVRGSARDLVVIVVHLKARADAESWARRERAGRALKRYLDERHATASVLVVGDWNDGIGRSITVGRASPFASFVADSANYRFVTSDLARQGVSSTSGNGALIDHVLASDEIAAHLVPGSVRVERRDDRRFRTAVSDHFPVRAAFALPP